MSILPIARFRLPGALLAASILVAAAFPADAATPAPKKGSTAAPATGAAAPSSAAATVPSKGKSPVSSPAGRLPGRVIIAEILTWDPATKAMKVKNLKGEEIDLVFGEKTELQGGDTLAVGQMVRARFEERDGKNIPIFVRILKSQDVDLARQALTDPNDGVNRKAITAASPAATTAPASAAPPAK